MRDAEDGVTGSNVCNSPNLLPANIRIENTFLESSVYSFRWKWFILKELLTEGDDERMGIQQQQHKKVPGSRGIRKLRQLSCILAGSSASSIKGAMSR